MGSIACKGVGHAEDDGPVIRNGLSGRKNPILGGWPKKNGRDPCLSKVVPPVTKLEGCLEEQSMCEIEMGVLVIREASFGSSTSELDGPARKNGRAPCLVMGILPPIRGAGLGPKNPVTLRGSPPGVTLRASVLSGAQEGPGPTGTILRGICAIYIGIFEGARPATAAPSKDNDPSKGSVFTLFSTLFGTAGLEGLILKVSIVRARKIGIRLSKIFPPDFIT